MSETLRFMEFQSIIWKSFFQFSLLLPAFSGMLIFYWYHNNWDKHPIADRIFKGSGITNRDNWRNIAVIIDNEMKSIDKFVSGVVPSKKMIITSNWLVKTDLYSVTVAQQTRVKLTVEQCNVYPINTNRSGDDDFVENISNSSHVYGEVQYLKIAVKDIQQNFVYFYFSVNSNEYEEIKSRINAPMNYARGVIVHQTLGEKFAAAFKEEALKNPIPIDLGMPANYLAESCIGCSLAVANVKLVRQCCETRSTTNNESTCGTCHCRPMWCIECLGRWFASRQLVAKRDPGVWMSQKASCPTCRSIFCILDVIVLQNQ